MKYPVIFFDLDGTLTDISKRHYEVYVECCEMFGGVPLLKDIYWELKRSDVNWNEILEKSKVNKINIKEFLDTFIEKIELTDQLDKDTTFPDAVKLLRILAESHTLVLVSLRRNRQALLEQLHRIGIDAIFTDILSGHSETKEGTLLKKSEVIKNWGDYSGGIIIGDTEADISAATQLGIDSIAVTTGIRHEEFLRSFNPTYIVSSIQDAGSIIKR